MSALDEILKATLPTRASRWVAAGTLALAATSIGLPDVLARLGVPVSTQTGLLVRAVSASTFLFVGTFIVLVLVLRHLREVKLNPKSASLQRVILDRGEPLLSILALIARNHSQEIPATPKLIAAELGLDENIVLAHMRKYHNEQYMTFQTGGSEPKVDTPFFLSAKAWKCITIAIA